MPPQSRSAAVAALPSKTLILDNGSHTIKAGLVPSEVPSTAIPPPHIIPNCLSRSRDKKIYIASELDACRDFNEMVFRRPMEKGYIVNWEAQRAIWEQEFFAAKTPSPDLQCDPKETTLLLTEAPNNLPQLQSNCDQMVFEEFGFEAYSRCLGG